MSARRNPSSPDSFRVLGVPRDATPSQIRAAYRALLLALHPDTNVEPTDPALLAEVVTAHAQLREASRHDTHNPLPPTNTPPTRSGIPIPVHVRSPRREQPDIRVGAVHIRLNR